MISIIVRLTRVILFIGVLLFYFPFQSPVTADTDDIWQWQNPLFNLRGVWGSSSSDVFAVGDYGYILHYNSTAWSAMTSGTSQNLNGVWGSSASDVFAVGTTGTIVHYNGSAWSAMTSSRTQGRSGVWGNAANDVYTVGEVGTMLHYNGTAWSAMDFSTNNTLYGCWGSSSSDVFAVGDYGTIMHYNGTASTPMTIGWVGGIGLYSVWGSSSSDVFAVGDYGYILRYNGTAWSAMTSGYTNRTLYGIWGSSSSDVFAVGKVNGNVSYIQHYNGIEWDTMASGSFSGQNSRGLTSVWGSSGSDVFAVGDSGTIVHYNGSTWSLMDSSITNPINGLRGVWGSSASDVFAVGHGGTIVHFNGSTWSSMTSGTVRDLTSIWGSSSSDVFAVGYGTILHYNGIAWSSMANTDLFLFGVWGSSGKDVFAVGSTYDTIIHYHGNGWTLMPIRTMLNLNSIWGNSSSDVFAVGGGGTILRFSGAPPTVNSSGADNITTTSANINGILSYDGGLPCRYRFLWDADSGPPYARETDWSTETINTGHSFSANIAGLTGGTSYYFVSECENSVGTGTSGENSFKTTSIPPTVATDNASGITATTATLNGTLISDGGEPCQYRFCRGTFSGIYTDNTTWSTDNRTTGQAFSTNITGLTSGTTYYYVAQAKNSAGTGSGTEKIFTTACTTPGVPFLSSPDNGSTVGGALGIFTWDAVTGSPSPTNYELQVNSNSTFTGTSYFSAQVGNVTSKQITTLPNNGATLYWRARAYNLCGWGAWPTGLSFINATVTCTKPGAPTLNLPAIGATVSGSAVTFAWTAGTGTPTKYWLQVNTNSNFTGTNKYYAQVNGTSQLVSGLPANGSTLYWRVQAGNDCGWSPWSTSRSFTNSAGCTKPGAPNLTSPANAGTVSGTAVTFTWTAGTGGPTKYWLQINTNSTFTGTNKYYAQVNGTSQLVSGLPANGSTL